MIAGAVMVYAHSFVPLGTVVAVALVAVAVSQLSLRQALSVGVAFGAVESISFWSFLVSGPALYATAAVVHTAGRAAFVLAATHFAKSKTPIALIAVPSTWVALEWIRTLGPYHPVSIGDGFGHHTTLIQVADLGGTYAVGFVVVAAGYAAGRAWLARSKVAACVAAAVLLGAYGYGFARLATDDATAPEVRVGLVQNSVPFWLYDLAYADPEFARIIEGTYISSLRAPPAVDLLVWPETAVPHGPTDTSTIRAALARPGRPDLLAGMLRRDAVGKHNSAVALPAGSDASAYDKRLLVPVMESHLVAGTEPTIVEVGGTTFASAICWESVFPAMVMNAQDAGALVVLTDPGAFGDSDMAELHARKSILRAVEQGRPTLHSSQTGPSWIIDHRGRISAAIEPWAVGTVLGAFRPTTGSTVFAATGGAFPMVATLLAVGLAFVRRRR